MLYFSRKNHPGSLELRRHMVPGTTEGHGGRGFEYDSHQHTAPVSDVETGVSTANTSAEKIVALVCACLGEPDYALWDHFWKPLV